MENTTDLLKFAPKPFQEVITLLGGMGFLLLLYFFKHDEIIKAFNPLFYDKNLIDFRIEMGLIFLVISYLVGRTVLCITFFIFQPEKITYLFSGNEDRMDIKVANVLSKCDFAEQDFRLTIFSQFFLAYSILGISLSSNVWSHLIWSIIMIISVGTWVIRDKRGKDWKKKARSYLNISREEKPNGIVQKCMINYKFLFVLIVVNVILMMLNRF
jgi:hypothetical protein